MNIQIWAIVAGSVAAMPAVAGDAQYSKAVQQACVADYKAHCGEYGIDSSALRACMDKAGQKLSHGCVRALVAGGQVSQAEVNSRKASGR
jgi:hypothetical protein